MGDTLVLRTFNFTSHQCSDNIFAAMPPVEVSSMQARPSLSDYRNYWAILSGVSLGCITQAEARKYLGLEEGDEIEAVDFTKLQGYEGAERGFLVRD